MASFEASAVIAAIVASGRHVFARDGQLVVEGPPLCAADRAVMREAKAEVLEELARRQAANSAPAVSSDSSP